MKSYMQTKIKKEHNEEKILEAIRKGVPILQISQRLGVPMSTLNWRLRNIKEYQLARKYYESWVDNMFNS